MFILHIERICRNRLVGIWEDSTCHYHVKAELVALCAISDFVHYKENVSIDALFFNVTCMLSQCQCLE